jgi:ribosomal protein S18 acetylase RimI-like enzyme
VIRPPQPGEEAAAQAVWEASSAHDDPGGRQRGGWSLSAWASAWRVLVPQDEPGRVVGVAAVRAPERDGSGSASGVVHARVVLEPAQRQPARASALVDATVELARAADGALVRQFIPARAEWVRSAVEGAGYRQVRTIYHMLRPADAPPFEARSTPGLQIRTIRPGEEQRVLDALNRAWAGTWAFMPIRLEQLGQDLDGQMDGMLLGVRADDADHIVATVHAIYDPADHNPDGQPRAYISNLTVDPDYRGLGYGRALLAAGLAHLQQRGARSISLGVDGGNATPLQLYRSAAFEVISSVEAWDRAL